MSLPMVTCPLCCQPGFTSSDTLSKSLNELKTKIIYCPICNFALTGLESFSHHLSSHFNPSVASSSKSFPDLLMFLEPKKVAESQEKKNEFQSCKDLLANFKTNEDEQDNEKNNFNCDECSYKFPNKAILAMHKQLVHKKEKNKKKLVCNICQQNFSLKSSLLIHKKVLHVESFLENEKIGSFTCEICGKLFKKESQLTQHMNSHDEKQCDVCSKTFTTKYFLKKHKRLHTGEMPYKCDICNKTFTFQQSYHKHLMYHKDEKPYCCTKCGRLFKELSTLHNHERIHSGEKPFNCDTCGKNFRQRVSYLVHRRIHTGAMPYKCTACDKTFRYKISQRTHKCASQPPGVVVRTQGLVERLQASLNKDVPELVSALDTTCLLFDDKDKMETTKDFDFPVEPMDEPFDITDQAIQDLFESIS